MAAQIVHLALKVENIEAAREFYEKIFGFEHTGTRRAGPLKDHMSCWLTDGQIGFTLIEYDSEDAPEAKVVGKGPCIHHFGIAVPPEEFDDYVKTITAAGCEIISPPGVNPMQFRAPGGGIGEVGTPDVFPR
jgi:catechol 2,3-dioxygenase-like lactoylglutathione lyase family enzyme